MKNFCWRDIVVTMATKANILNSINLPSIKINFISVIFPSYKSYLSVTKSTSFVTLSYLSFYDFVPRTSFSNENLNKDISTGVIALSQLLKCS